MHANTAITKTEILDAIVARIGERLPEGQAALVGAFTRHYYRGTDIRDLQQHDLADLYGAVLAHYNLAARRAAGSTKLHVYNPQLEQHGWQSTHTVIEVVCDDSPFLVDSLRLALNRHGLTCHLLIHPVFHLHRDGQGRLREVLAEETASDDVRVEAVMHFEVDRQTEPEVLQALEQELVAVLAQVHRVVGDWQPMLEQLNRVVAELEQHPPPLSQAEVDQALAFLRWVAAEHFTFLGYREYDLFDEADGLRLQAREGSGLGLLRDGDGGEARGFAMLDSDGQRQATAPELLVVTKTSRRSTVHRPAFMDYIGIKRLDDQGRVVGEYRFLGLYSASAYNRSAREIPLLQQKVDRVLEQAGYPRGSHARRALLNILESYPRDELFQTTPDELLEITLGILHLQERQRVSLFVRRDPYGRFISCLVFAPRERFSTEVRQAITRVLESSFGGECLDFSLQISESALARIHFLIGVRGGQPASSWDLEEIEQRLAATTRDWRDDLADALLDHFGEERGTALLRRYGSAFRADYREHYPASVACYDIARMEQLVDGAELAMTLYRPPELPPSQLRFKLFQAERPTPLSETLPMLENMGLKVIEESPTTIHPAAQAPLWIHDFGLEHREEGLDLALITDKFQETFARVWRGEVENDGFNRLVLRAQLEWRQIVVLRAYCKYLRQVRATFSQEYMERTLDANPRIARLLAELFMARFDPTQAGDPQAEAELIHQIDEALDAVSNLDEDRILRGFLHAIHATLRTNYFQRGADGQPKKYLSFKFDPARVPDMPEPRPLFEIFVYSPRVEGVHLRGGKVARGGLRWSDRREDFRTEVLGLVKAQMVKNAVIVPVGSKGGFVCKALPGGNDREALQAEVVASYKTFISGLLDLTDNLVDGAVVPPPEVVRHDPDDPYLVVAADKGTATFSDIANGVARDYGFWLDDAFASGGSAGYDHKKMGITARGGWESVKRHFRELGLDTQTQDFTVAGIGDMSGDVFGNGMLLSEHSRLVAAFDHRHIFIDPAPDPARSFAERRRLFALPRSSWDDYQRKLLSAGGGIWPRSVKSIELPPEARQALGVEQTRFSPNELIRAILKAPVDLLWNGGIGTYVKARNENHADVGDRSSDAVRVDAPELRCRVVGEGGNLGLTQRARIEFAQHGGRINTDAIDNSGGVDCSDHEVNIKILLNAVVTAGDMTRKQRDRLLEQMTDEVAALVLRNNYLQTEALSVAESQAPGMLHVHVRLLRKLEKEVGLNRALEYLPSEDELAERRARQQGLTRPEFAVLLAYVKIGLFQALLASDLPGEPDLASTLVEYFPTPLRTRFGEAMVNHRLRREIVATQLANAVVNRAGMTFVDRLATETGASTADLVRAWAIAGRVFGLSGVCAEIEALDARVPAELQHGMLLEVRKLGERATRWLLRHGPCPLLINATVEAYAPGIRELEAKLNTLLGTADRDRQRQRMTKLRRAGIDEALARRISSLTALVPGLDIVEVARAAGVEVTSAAGIYFTLGQRLGLTWLAEQVTALSRENQWQSLARAALRDDLLVQQRVITAEVLQTTGGGRPAARVEQWCTAEGSRLARYRQVLEELEGSGSPDFTMLSVALRELRVLAR